MPMYRYVHNKDGRTGQSENGSWYAIKLALGEKEASDLVDRSRHTSWHYKKNEMKSELMVDEERVGTFYKE